MHHVHVPLVRSVRLSLYVPEGAASLQLLAANSRCSGEDRGLEQLRRPSDCMMIHEDYTVAWICALPLEAAASKAMLDKIHPQLSQSTGDDNAYTLGEISGHNI